MMNDFEGLMNDITNFINITPSQDLIDDIKKTAEQQRAFKSKHKYNLDKFNLTESQIKSDCEVIYKTFLNNNNE